MDSGKSDFSSLLRALGSGGNSGSFSEARSSPPFQLQQPQQFQSGWPSSYATSIQPQPAPQPLPVKTGVKTSTLIIVGVIVLAILICVIIAWMRMNRVQEEDTDTEEEESYLEKARKLTREIPAPSQALPKPIGKQVLKQASKKVDFVEPQEEEVEEVDDNEINEYVSRNLRNFAEKQNSNVVDISGFDLPTEYVPPPPPRELPNQKQGKIVADESQEVLDYGKKREALFN